HVLTPLRTGRNPSQSSNPSPTPADADKIPGVRSVVPQVIPYGTHRSRGTLHSLCSGPQRSTVRLCSNLQDPASRCICLLGSPYLYSPLFCAEANFLSRKALVPDSQTVRENYLLQRDCVLPAHSTG